MLSKFSVSRFSPPFVRHLGGLTTLEKYEKLRKLCCTSDVEKSKSNVNELVRPQTAQEEDECCPKPPTALLDIRCKSAVVLGGASAVGYETARSLLEEGVFRVVIADINQLSGVEVTKKLCSTFGNGKAFFIKTDLRQQLSIEGAFKEICKFLGQMHIYVNCVGIYNETPQCWDKMVRTNLIGCVRGTLLAYKYLGKANEEECSQGSVIVNVSSYGSIANVPSMPFFSAISNGINGLTSSFGQDFHYSRCKVRCVTVCPACTDSGLLRNMDRLHYDRKWVSHSASAIKCCTKQSPKVVGRAILTAVKYGVNGSVYVIKEGKYYRYAMPDYVKLMRQEAILL